jgi:hypothetical protein
MGAAANRVWQIIVDLQPRNRERELTGDGYCVIKFVSCTFNFASSVLFLFLCDDCYSSNVTVSLLQQGDDYDDYYIMETVSTTYPRTTYV